MYLQCFTDSNFMHIYLGYLFCNQLNLVTAVYSWAKPETTLFASHLHFLFLSYDIQNLQWLLCEFYVAEKHKVVPNCYVQTKQKGAMEKSQVSLLWYLLNKKITV